MKSLLVFSLFLVDCSGGGIGESCEANQDCDPGLACVTGRCGPPPVPSTDAEEPGTDAGTDASTDAGTDAVAMGTDAGTDASTCLVGHCYFVVFDSVDWDTARAACEASAMHLVTIADGTEGSYVYGLVGSGLAWIGLSNDGTSCAFSWVTGEPLSYTDWGSAQPDQCSVRACGFFWNAAPWGDGPCDLSVPAYVCESE